MKLEVVGISKDVQCWFNGHEMKIWDRAFGIHKRLIEPNDVNLIVLRFDKGKSLTLAPRMVSGDRGVVLKGKWQFRIGDDPNWSNIPLPARYGTSTDIVFEP